MLYVQPGQEKWIPLAKRELARLKARLALSGAVIGSRPLSPESGTTVIVRTTPFKDLIYITGGTFGRWIWSYAEEPPGSSQKWVFRATPSGVVTAAEATTKNKVEWSLDYSTVVDIDTTAHTATKRWEVAGADHTQVITDVTTLYDAASDPTWNQNATWYRQRHAAVSRDGKTIVLRSTDDTHLIATAKWNANTLQYDVTRVGPPAAVQQFMDGAASVTWETDWFTGTSVNAHYDFAMNYLHNAPGTADVRTLKPMPKYWLNPYRCEVAVLFTLAYVNSPSLLISNTSTPPASLSRLDGRILEVVFRLIDGEWVEMYRPLDEAAWWYVSDRYGGSYPTDASNTINVVNTTGVYKFQDYADRGTLFVAFDASTGDSFCVSWPNTTYDTADDFWGEILVGDPSAGHPLVPGVAPFDFKVTSSRDTPLASTTVLRNGVAWVGPVFADIGALSPQVLSIGEANRVLVLDKPGGNYNYTWVHGAAGETLSLPAVPDPHQAFLSRSGRYLYLRNTGAAADGAARMYKDGALKWASSADDEFAVGDFRRTSYRNDGTFEDDGLKLAIPTERTVNGVTTWRLHGHTVVPSSFNYTGDVITPAVPATPGSAADMAALLVAGEGLSLGDFAALAGTDEAGVVSACQSFLDGAPGALEGLYITYSLNFYTSLQDFIDAWFGEGGHTEAQLRADLDGFFQSYADDAGTPAVPPVVETFSYAGLTDFWMDEFVPPEIPAAVV